MQLTKASELTNDCKNFLKGYLQDYKCVDFIPCEPTFSIYRRVRMTFITAYDSPNEEVEIRFEVERSKVRGGNVCWFCVDLS